MSLTEEEKKKIEEEERVRAEARSKYDKPTIIEATGKKWKKMSAIGIVATIIGFLFIIGSFTNNSPGAGVFGSILFVVGGCMYIWSKLGAWWYHR
ncbi:MAG: hypothetical protein A3B91_05035 [Candidatus Yanofskybacteria bacterium RIFCSPHIGHO2_02_FULL_41_29]|uniref:Uncharacterized protein n=2 Tax=Patescibacteria group TaxID=1783273 RepID=A0A1F5NIP4_9BACT|nr:MAG: hypothetical protein A3J19_03190 [Candidatus Daviesbacteria bacterium RIFCSPLOWO2_02_FULL_41_8]OGN00685.1 MAG: hypothetical protein A2650_04035 [Candidatus Yanofskybacteria bacterium RIFCSPHIGHO2_01_FULL_41_53]OGN11660.1 MAG: hypothetical protein A3B91_05035 [Candidatus Yanofskybacteria bacterium RIFCSPHIGHO2_02_FULL_41_29]OGN23420.1 MAG: hypothetical protein A2916_03425 [Candidatus Yanofskybacteria bacterium RIFCSPLOWO2_01_FULL_41_67]